MSTVVLFGKHKNKSIETIYEIDRSYVMWLSESAYDKSVKEAAKKVIEMKKSEDKLVLRGGKYIINFGKFYGKSLQEAYKVKPSYMNWMLRTFEDNTLIQEVVTNFVIERKAIAKRHKEIVKARETRIYNEKIEAANKLYGEISLLDKSNFYIFPTTNDCGSYVFKINDVNIKEDNVSLNITEYVYNAVKDTFDATTTTRNTNRTNKLPIKFIPNIYEVIFITKNKRNVYDVNGEKITDVKTKTDYNVKIMSDIYDDVTHYFYKGAFLYSACSMISGVSEGIYSDSKIIKVVIDDEQLENKVRLFKLPRLRK